MNTTTSSPSAWAINAVLADGGSVHIRPIKPGDATAHRVFFARQSKQSVYFRFFGPRSELTDLEVSHFTTVDYHGRMAFVAFLGDDMIAVGRYEQLACGDEAEVAFAVADAHQGRGLATLLLWHLARYAAAQGIRRFSADTLIDNRRMLKVFKAVAMGRASRSIDHGVVHLAFGIAPKGDVRADGERTQSQYVRLGPASASRLGEPKEPCKKG